MKTIIAVRNLEKTFKPKRGAQAAEAKAVAGISFEVGQGEFFGLLAPNGAGKTTSLRV